MVTTKGKRDQRKLKSHLEGGPGYAARSSTSKAAAADMPPDKIALALKLPPNHQHNEFYHKILGAKIMSGPTTIDMWLDQHEAAKYLSVSVGTLGRWRRLGTGPQYAARLGRDARYLASVLHKWMEDTVVENTAQAAKVRKQIKDGDL